MASTGGSPRVSAPPARATTWAAISRGHWLPARLTAPVSAAFSHSGQRTDFTHRPDTKHLSPSCLPAELPSGSQASVPTTACSLQVHVLHDPRVGLCPPGPLSLRARSWCLCPVLGVRAGRRLFASVFRTTCWPQLPRGVQFRLAQAPQGWLVGQPRSVSLLSF